ncbi:MAG TPA: hypothetical protein VMA53_00680 [Stellaceae bacterium]|nr:hypothetical protein [Stellaceae bacterium]
MAEPTGSPEQAALWRRWCEAAATPGEPTAAEPDALTLAAYAEDRLSAEGVEAVEDWLAANSQIASDILAARQAATFASATAPEAVIARAAALVGGGAQILPFRAQAARPSWRNAIAWGAMAASILVASLVGFAMGNSTYATLIDGSSVSLSQELLDPPTGLFNADEDSAI